MKNAPEITVDIVRALYPNPSRITGECLRSKYSYCVLGALNKWYSFETELGFPDDSVGRQLLKMANTELVDSVAYEFSGKISTLNDSGDFEAAWNKLDEALKWRAK